MSKTSAMLSHSTMTVSTKDGGVEPKVYLVMDDVEAARVRLLGGDGAGVGLE
jgi:hypothetical protein